MREILFRGKTDKGEWVVGLLVKDFEFYGEKDEHSYIVTHEHPSGCFGSDIYIEVIPETVGQYTGLADKNGTKIFEGDIIRELDGGMDGIPRMVKWDEEFKSYKCPLIRWHWAYKDNNCSFWLMKSKNIEVIGNIHDNRELFESEVEGE